MNYFIQKNASIDKKENFLSRIFDKIKLFYVKDVFISIPTLQ